MQIDWYPPTPTPRPVGALPEGYEIDLSSYDFTVTAQESIQTYHLISDQVFYETVSWLMVILVIVFGIYSIIVHVQYMNRKQ